MKISYYMDMKHISWEAVCRDSILGRVPQDWDITTSATPQEVKQLFSRTVDTGIEHGTVTVMLGKEGFEVTTYRMDGAYEDGRHPKEVTFTRSLTEDLKRRDFTINAMAYNDTDRSGGSFWRNEGSERTSDPLRGRSDGAIFGRCTADSAGGSFFGAACISD